MRKVQVFCGVEAIVLGVLVALWSQRAEPEPVPGPPPVLAQAAADSAPMAGSGTVPGAPTHREANEREAVSIVSDAGTPGVVLHGRLLSSTVLVKDDVVRLSCRGDAGYRNAEFGDGQTYAFADLRPGRWHVQCEVKGYRLLEFDHEIGTAAIQRLDLTLEPTLVLPIFIQTSAGKRLHAEMAKAEIWQRLQVVATTEPIPGDLAATESSSMGNFGAGRHRRTWDMNQLADENGDDGTLEIDAPLPVYAAVLLRHMVLARQRVDPGQSEVRFTVDMETLRERFVTVRARLLDEHGQPLPKAWLELSSAQGGGGRGGSGEDGTVVIKDVLPGIAMCELRATDRRHDAWHVHVPPGTDLDLGDVALGPQILIRGEVAGADDKPVAASLRWTNLDRWQSPLPLMDRRSTSADVDGNFTIGVGAHRYLVAARTKDGRTGFGVFDGRGGAGTGFRITVRPTTGVTIVAIGPVHITYIAIVRHPDGHPLAVSMIEPRSRQRTIELPAGNYQLELHTGEATLLRREPLVVGDTALRVEVGR